MDYEELYEEDLANITVNDIDYSYPTPPLEIALETIQLIVCFTGTAVDILMIFIIGKYKNMRKPVNIYIMNWLICDALFILTEPVEYHLFTLMEGLKLNRVILCVMSATMTIVWTVDVVFMLVIMFQWFFDKTTVVVFDRQPYRLVLGVWMFGLVEFVLITISCFHVDAHVIRYIEDKIWLILILIFLVCFAKIHCLRRCANPFSSASSLPVALLSGFVLCWLVMFILTVIYVFEPHQVFKPLYYLGQFSINLYPLLMFYLFYKIDPQFAICTRILFRCSRSEEVATAMNFDVISASEEDIT